LFKIHGFLDEKLVINRRLEHLFRVGDIVRFADDKYAEVTEIVWCMDEPCLYGQRVNVNMSSQLVE